jgi:hypothetical protein
MLPPAAAPMVDVVAGERMGRKTAAFFMSLGNCGSGHQKRQAGNGKQSGDRFASHRMSPENNYQ